jgi:hypothetical protein
LAFKDCLRKRAEGRIGTSRHATTAGGGTAFATLRAALLGSGGQHGALWVSKEQQSEGYPVCSFQVITSSWGRWEIFEQLLHGFVEGLLLLFLCADLRVELLAPALVHWSADNWKTFVDVNTMDSGLGLHYVDLPTNKLPVGGKVIFTFFWPDARKWEKTNWEVSVVPRGIDRRRK